MYKESDKVVKYKAYICVKMSWGTELWVSFYSLFVCLIIYAGLVLKKAVEICPQGNSFLSLKTVRFIVISDFPAILVNILS